MKKIDKLAEKYGMSILHLNGDDIELIVRLLHQELDAVHNIIENIEKNVKKVAPDWYDRADHCEDLIIQLLR